MKTRIYIVDENALFRKGLAVLINAEADMEVCGEGEDCAPAMQDILKLQPAVVVADIALRGSSGIELIKNVRAMAPKIQFLVLSMYDEFIYAPRVLRVGAKGYVMKQDAANSTIKAIRTILKGQLYLSEEVATQMLNRYAHGEEMSDDSPVANLSDRELEVLNLIGAGVPTREIATRLHVSVKTVETHRAHLKTKLNVGTAPRLIQFAVRWVDQSNHLGRLTPALGAEAPTPGRETPDIVRAGAAAPDSSPRATAAPAAESKPQTRAVG